MVSCTQVILKHDIKCFSHLKKLNLYVGKKKDSWFLLDPLTGQRQHILGWDHSGPTCPIESRETIYLGRTQYTIMMIDTQNGNRKWNVTFYEYSAMPMSKDNINNYG